MSVSPSRPATCADCEWKDDFKPTLERIRVDEDKRDLGFGAWHRGVESPGAYDSDVVFAQVHRKGEDDHSEWLQDTESVVAQMREPLPHFEWPPPVPSRPPGL